MKIIFLKSISFYQKFISPFFPRACVFYPTCSEYAKQAVEKYGTIKGIKLFLRRIFSCHPWQKNHLDPLK